MPTVVCPSCQRKVRVPEHLAGRQLICPACNDAVETPSLEAAYLRIVEHTPPPGPALTSAAEAPLSLPARLGALSMFLGTFSVLVLCLPFVGYAAPGISGIGLLIGFCGLVSACLGGGSAPAGGIRSRRFGERGPDYPLAGIGMCLLALTLALLPFLFR
jgi:hypothetical protein